MPAQRDLAHINDLKQNIILDIQLGNANIGDSTISIEGNPVLDTNGLTLHLKNSFHYDLGPASLLKNKEIEVLSLLSPNPAVSDRTLILTYSLVNASFLTPKSRKLTSASYDNNNDSFEITIKLI